MEMELPTLQVYYTIDSPGGQCCRGSAPVLAVFAEHFIQTALNLFFPFLLLFWRKHRRETFQHNGLSLKRDGSGLFLIGYGLYHMGLLFESGLNPAISLLSCGETRKDSTRQRVLPLRLFPRFGPVCPGVRTASAHNRPPLLPRSRNQKLRRAP